MDLDRYKAGQRRVWEAGDYRQVGRLLGPAARALVGRAGVAAGQRVLDVATGSGNVAVAAARAGASVVGVDITDRWFDEARRSAEAARVEVELLVGDAEALPSAAATFDVVLSGFGVMFAPRHDVAAAELVRVCRPGGTIGVTAWRRDTSMYQLFSILSAELADPPAFVMPPPLWGDEAYVRELFAPHGVDLAVEHHELPVVSDGVDAFESFVFDNSGGFIEARRALQAAGRWDHTYATLRRAVEEANEADDGSFRLTWDYLIITATLPG